MKGKSHLISILLMVALPSCQWISDFIAGDMTELRVELPHTFDRMDVKGSFHLIIIPDTIGYALIRCPEHVQSDVGLEVKDDVLFVREKVRYRWAKDYPIVEVELHQTALPMIEIRQPCKLTIPQTFRSHQFYLVDWGNYVDCDAKVDVDFIRIDVSGESFGSYRVAGKAEYGLVNSNGAALINLRQAQVSFCTVNQNSVSDVSVWVTQRITINLNSSGNVYLSGNPIIELNKQGSGSLVQLP